MLIFVPYFLQNIRPVLRMTWQAGYTGRHEWQSWRPDTLRKPDVSSCQLWAYPGASGGFPGPKVAPCNFENWETERDNRRNVPLTTVTRSVTRDMSRGVTLRHFITFQMMEPERVGGGKRWWGTGRKTFNLSRPQYLFDIYLHISCVSTSWTGLTLPDFFEQMRRNPSPGATKTL